ncbi:MAG TPA: polymer-forming cytoskeletal protein [Patescibacteria group bacterium]|nr:polymer-forming cytoskeletal protein [Patescibacteria group bacterium]
MHYLLKKLVKYSFVFLMIAFVALPAQATTHDTTSVDSVHEEVGGMSLHAGNMIRLTDVVDRDVYAAGYQISFGNEIQGDVFAAGSDITIDQHVTGSVRVAGSTIIINGEVDGNVLAFGNSIRIEKDAVIHGHVNAYGASITIDGTVDQSVDSRGAFVTLNSTLNSPAYIEAEQVEVGSNAVLNDAVRILGPKKPTIAAQATGAEHITYEYKESNNKKGSGATPTTEWVQFVIVLMIGIKIYAFLVMVILGIILLAFVPKFVRDVTANMVKKQSGTVWLTGVLTVLLVPMVAIMLAITLIGIPFALLLMLLYGIILCFSTLFVGVVVGDWIFKKKHGPYLSFFVGFLLVSIVFAIPFLGWMIKLGAIIWGTGGILYTFWANRSKKKK